MPPHTSPYFQQTAYSSPVYLLWTPFHWNSLLYVYDHLMYAIGSQNVSWLCLLDLSVAFDTIDHSILLTRLSSWFGIHGSVLNWFKSYLSSRSFRVRCNNTFSSLLTFSYGVPQGSVLGPLLFIMYTTNPSPVLLSPFSFNHHHLYVDTQLFFSFHPPNLDSRCASFCLWNQLPTSLRQPHPSLSKPWRNFAKVIFSLLDDSSPDVLTVSPNCCGSKSAGGWVHTPLSFVAVVLS